MDRATELANELGGRVREVGGAVAGEVSERVRRYRERAAARRTGDANAPSPGRSGTAVAEDVVNTLGEVASETGRRVRGVAGRLGREMRKRMKK